MFEQVFRSIPTSKVKRYSAGVPNRMRQGITNQMQASRNKAVTAQSMATAGFGKTTGYYGLGLMGIGLGIKYRSALNTALYRPSKNILKKMTAGFGRSKMIMGSSALLGTLGMTSIALMNGAMGHAQDHVMERYMRDARYSSKLLTSAKMGSATGNPQLNLGNHTGIALALHKNRH